MAADGRPTLPTAAPASCSEEGLRAIVGSRAWLRSSDPFPHILARDVFAPAVYRELETAFGEILDRGVGETGELDRLSRSIPGYDALAMPLSPALPSPFHIFFSRWWHALLEGVTGVPATGEINGGLHHHLAGSAAGAIHNDLNPGWFPRRAGGDRGIALSDHRVCSYRDGRSRTGTATVEVVRGVAMLFYLGNGPWAEGDGGETGLYRSAGDPLARPARAVPPFDNSMLIFECRPNSYHAFLGNRRRARSSVILWLHQSAADAERLWGRNAIVRWPVGR